MTAKAPPIPDYGDDHAWRKNAACRGADPETFFPIFKRGRGANLQSDPAFHAAMAYCDACPVLEPCRRFAIDTGQDYGIWGGMDEEQRRELRRQLGLRGGRK